MKKESRKLQRAYKELGKADGTLAPSESDSDADGEFEEDDTEMVVNRKVLRGDLWENLNYFKY